MDRTSQNRARRARQQREGIVMLVVMLMLMMATGTALFTMQATQYEQRSSGAVGEANWVRGVAESVLMGALAFVEATSITTSGQVPVMTTLGAQWRAGSAGAAGAVYQAKYDFPVPSAGAALPPLGADVSASTSLEMPFTAGASTPLGVDGFMPGAPITVPLLQPTARIASGYFGRCPRPCPYPLSAARDGGGQGNSYWAGHWLQEMFSTGAGTPPGALGSGPTPRIRTVITAFAEEYIVGDQPDENGQREIHELDALARGYFDNR